MIIKTTIKVNQPTLFVTCIRRILILDKMYIPPKSITIIVNHFNQNKIPNLSRKGGRKVNINAISTPLTTFPHFKSTNRLLISSAFTFL